MEKLYRADGIPAILSAAQIPEAGFSAGPEDIEWSRYSNFALLHTSGGGIILWDKLEGYAWDFIYNTVAGPLTNVAAFLISYPALVDRIEQIALMDKLPDGLTYPDIQPRLMEEAGRRGYL